MTTLQFPEELYPPQIEFCNAKSRFVAYGGARGGGKSYISRWKAIMLALRYPGIQILVIRRRLTELRENFVLPMTQSLMGIAPYNTTNKEFNFSNGSRAKLGFCESEADAFQYQGQQYDIIFIDEATQLSENMFVWISSACRGTNKFPKRIYLTCNPGGVGHSWVKRLFIDRDYRRGEKAQNYTFIPAKATDNKALCKNDPEYLDWLDALPDGIREAWRDGNWDVYDGQYFPEFSRDLHVCEPHQIPDWWRRYVTIDYGLDMFAAYWIAVGPNDEALVYREIYKSNLIVSAAASLLRDYNNGDQIAEFLAPPDLWNRRNDTGKSAADIFAEYGIFLIKTSNERIAGWRSVKEMLNPVEVGKEQKQPKMKIFSNCKNLIRCLPLLQHDDKNVEDVATEPHEITHAPDALRGFCAYRYYGSKAPGEKAAPLGSFTFSMPRESDYAAAYGYGERMSVI